MPASQHCLLLPKMLASLRRSLRRSCCYLSVRSALRGNRGTDSSRPRCSAACSIQTRASCRRLKGFLRPWALWSLLRHVHAWDAARPDLPGPRKPREVVTSKCARRNHLKRVINGLVCLECEHYNASVLCEARGTSHGRVKCQTLGRAWRNLKTLCTGLCRPLLHRVFHPATSKRQALEPQGLHELSRHMGNPRSSRL